MQSIECGLLLTSVVAPWTTPGGLPLPHSVGTPERIRAEALFRRWRLATSHVGGPGSSGDRRSHGGEIRQHVLRGPPVGGQVRFWGCWLLVHRSQRYAIREPTHAASLSWIDQTSYMAGVPTTRVTHVGAFVR